MMYVVLVEFRLHPGSAEAFMPLIRKQARTSLERESGCHRFDICVDAENAENVLLYEVYDDRAAFDVHLESPHFIEFDRAVASLVAEKSVRTM